MSVGWILCSNEQTGSSRIHGINLHKGLQSRNILSCLLRTPQGYIQHLEISKVELNILTNARFKIVIFQRVHGGKAVQLCRKLQNRGTLCGFFMADLFNVEMMKEVDFILTPSDFIRNHLIANGYKSDSIFVLPDAVETSRSIKKRYHQKDDSTEMIRVVWVGNANNWPAIIPLRKLFETCPDFEKYQLITISDHPQADIKWELESVWANILSCDIGIVPADITKPEALAKSNNRVTMFMALGIPVVCSPLPAYKTIIVNHKNGFIAETENDWKTCLYVLKDAKLRKIIGEAAYEDAHHKFNRENITTRLIEIFNGLLEQ